MTSQRIYILTWCSNLEVFFGTTLVFESVRTGFPNAQIFVLDNASQTDAREQLRHKALQVGAQFHQLEHSCTHASFIKGCLMQQKHGCAIFLDPDIAFWNKVEDWTFDATLAGRLIPKHACEFTGCITLPRIHTSFLWMPDVKRIRMELAMMRIAFPDCDPFRPHTFKHNGAWHRLDTCASMYANLSHRCTAFNTEQLDCFDHLFCGTHFLDVAPCIDPRFREHFVRLLRDVQLDYRAMRGIWRLQDEYFASRCVES